MKEFISLAILTPEQTLFQGRIKDLQVPTKMGLISILLDHSPLISVLDNGVVYFTDETHNKQKLNIKGGMLKTEKNQLTILTS